MEQPTVSREVDRLYRAHFGEMVTSLVSYFRLANIQLAEDLVQQTFTKALSHWEEKGVPDQPRSWLYRVCKNLAIDVHRQRRDIALDTLETPVDDRALDRAFLPDELHDNQLRLLFALCHPAFNSRSQVIIMLKSMGGLTVQQIALGLGMSEDAVKKAITRIRQEIRQRNLPLKIPFILQSRERLDSVHHVLYLMFSEGYASSAGDTQLRKELCLESIRLCRSLMDDDRVRTRETEALFSLMLFSVARFDARLDAEGVPIDLEWQDRSKWDQGLISAAVAYFNRSRDTPQWSRYHCEAAIASFHAMTPTFDATNWSLILKMYDRLMQLQPSPYVKLNRAIAMAYSGLLEEASREIGAIEEISDHENYRAAQGKVAALKGDTARAIDLYLDAISVSKVPARRRFLERVLDQLREQSR